ncbi:hypothetical protein WCN65_15155, partial [Staphylococcus aureus]
KKQFYVTLKLNNEIIKQLFNNNNLDEVLLSTSSLFLPQTQLKALYLTVIDRIDIRKDENHKKQFYVTLKLNNEIIKQLFNNNNLDEVLLSTSS